ncbi:MAG TPA: ribonuclease H-like domain-containing protein [Fimbriimonadaceae bacterium]|nr:ribonuclease H-like domain-containing protein [Fimbriimonadaceae bacterium]
MLRRTFIHVPGIGRTTEKALWKQGCATWDDYLQSGSRFSTGHADRGAVRDYLERSRCSLESGDHQFFMRSLGLRESWRAYNDFKHSCVYLDIETDGRSITTIGLYDGSRFVALVKGENLENFRDEISRYSMIVTFCGSSFDLPALERSFAGVTLDQIHVDLCPIMRKLGYRGGLKRIEKEFGIQRPPEIDGLSGFDAVILWRRFYGLHDEQALERLIAYNREDCVNLERLAEAAASRMQALTFDM